MTCFIVKIDRPRPDFRVFIDLLFGPGRNVDTDGDADIVWSRDWRELYIKDRESDAPPLEIYAAPESPSQFEIKSEDPRLAELAAVYLHVYCGHTIEYGGASLSRNEVEALQKPYQQELKRANASIWHESSEKNPFPNQTRQG